MTESGMLMTKIPDAGERDPSSAGGSSTIDSGIASRTNETMRNGSASTTVDQSTFTKVLPGEYARDVFGTVGQRFELIVNDRHPAKPGEPSPAPGVQTVPVCSNSFAADPSIPVGATRQIVKSGSATIAEEVEILGENGPNTANHGEGNTLPEGTRLDVKTFNGLPCE